MIVVIYEDAGKEQIATAYKGRTLAQVKADGWENNPLVSGFYEVDDLNVEDIDGGPTWQCSLSAKDVVESGTCLSKTH